MRLIDETQSDVTECEQFLHEPVTTKVFLEPHEAEYISLDTILSTSNQQAHASEITCK